MSKNEKKAIAVYSRVSDAESIEKSSIEDQVKEGTSFAEKKWLGHPVKAFRELKTASTISGRPIFLEMIREAKGGHLLAIVVRDQDRLSRETGEMLALYKAQMKWV